MKWKEIHWITFTFLTYYVTLVGQFSFTDGASLTTRKLTTRFTVTKTTLPGQSSTTRFTPTATPTAKATVPPKTVVVPSTTPKAPTVPTTKFTTPKTTVRVTPASTKPPFTGSTITTRSTTSGIAKTVTTLRPPTSTTPKPLPVKVGWKHTGVNYNSVVKDKSAFVDSVANYISSLINFPSDKITNRNAYPGSIVVEMTLQPGADKSPQQASDELRDKILNDQFRAPAPDGSLLPVDPSSFTSVIVTGPDPPIVTDDGQGWLGLSATYWILIGMGLVVILIVIIAVIAICCPSSSGSKKPKKQKDEEEKYEEPTDSTLERNRDGDRLTDDDKNL